MHKVIMNEILYFFKKNIIFTGERVNVVCLSLLSLFSLIFMGKGIPYGSDNNETFSSIVHAFNLINYGLSFNYGLADETYSNALQAHSIVHTHQGNFPRLFASLIYIFGAKSPEAQILVTSIFVGVPAIILAFEFIRMEFGRPKAYICLLMLLTDYTMFLQWHVNTYRVWHLFFLSSSLLCNSLYARKYNKYYLYLLSVIFILLFYWEMVFAVFILTLNALWSVWSLRNNLSRVKLVLMSCVFGASLGIICLITQLVLFYGWRGLLADVRLTYLSRNLVSALSISDFNQIKIFMHSNHVLFIPNFIAADQIGRLDILLKSILTYGINMYSPGLITLTMTLSLSAIVCNINLNKFFSGLTNPYIFLILELLIILYLKTENLFFAFSIVGVLLVKQLLDKFDILREKPFEYIDKIIIIELILIITVWVFFISHDSYVIGLTMRPNEFHFSPEISIVILLVCCYSSYSLISLSINERGVQYAEVKVGKVIFYFLLLILYTKSNKFLTSEVSVDYYQNLFIEYFSYNHIVRLLIICGSVVGVSNIFVSYDDGAKLSSIFVIMACCFVGSVVIILWNPGYFYSGYVVRELSFFTLFNYLGLTLGLSHVIEMRIKFAEIKEKLLLNKIFNSLGLMIIFATSVFWLMIQLNSLRLLPPDNYASLINTLRKFHNKTSVTNTYAAPFFVATGNWSYWDDEIIYGKMLIDANKIEYVKSSKFLWFADADSNQAYQKPDIFVCYEYATMMTRMRNVMNLNFEKKYCMSAPLVKISKQLNNNSLYPKLLAEDKSKEGRWAIVNLNLHE